ncbi:glycerophosphodiester phosphodiesterase family protein [Tardisphaera miroshnichenkoae]
MLVIGHRGFPAAFPENTIPSFLGALRAGADGVELDVHLSKDGVPVVIHDYYVDRTTNGSGRVSSFTAEQLKHLDAGAKFGMPGVSVPMLREVLQQVKEEKRDAVFIIEIKRGSAVYPGIEERVVSEVKEEGVRAQLVSFDYDSLKLVKKAWSEAETGIIFVGRPSYFCAIAKEVGSAWLRGAHDLVQMGDAELVHERGLKLDVWAPSNPDELKQVASMGPDSITTNDPRAAISLLRRSCVKIAFTYEETFANP